MDVSIEEIKRIVLEIAENLSSNIASDQNLIESGLLDSFMVMELIDAFEEKYQIEFPPEAIIPDNFENINTICKMLTAIIKKES